MIGESYWSNWIQLNHSQVLESDVKHVDGVYKIRARELPGYVYIGETSNLRRRIRTLDRKINQGEIPFRDPHTAAPCLWAINQEFGPKLEVSYQNLPEADDRIRKGYEAFLIAQHRKKYGYSPIANFGRILPGYVQSSYREKGKRGEKTQDIELKLEKIPEKMIDAPPLDWKKLEKVRSNDWLNLSWTKPRKMNLENIKKIPMKNGFYRIWKDSKEILTYIGQSKKLKNRLKTHNRKMKDNYSFSVAIKEDLTKKPQNLATETEMIGVHFKAKNEPPKKQF
ncbi:MAG: GIY-YIG superfamily endonuclease [Candidatus Methanohalarchaeum thermophilum]|uniref:GIY-YIG superfamily endonuclease n=1 Tax=Methanohalarchaeum thermophilum TaxID=1903181 RepID=A0A1Q6DVD7_METT1|nr:MAG: GIY-YIG superfamily endonuclease [Candidatus Methanohalarchaeum thermophilum]